MKRILLPFTLSLAAMGLSATAQQPAPLPSNIAVPESARKEIQAATDQLNAALRRGDVAGTLKWLAPSFELGHHQYRVRDLEWMKRALPLQLKRGRYTALSSKILLLEVENDVINTTEKVNAKVVLNRGIAPANQQQQMGIRGAGSSEWVQTAQGWRLRRGNMALEQLLLLAAPEAPLRQQPPLDTTSSAAAAGMALQEPERVWERRAGQFETAFAFSPDTRQLAFDFDAEHLRFVSPQSGELHHEAPSQASLSMITYTRDGHLWTADGLGRVRQWKGDGSCVLREWTVAREYSPYKVGVAPAGGAFAVAENNEVRLWNPANTQPALTLTPSLGRPDKLQYSPDNKWLALGNYQGVEVHSGHDGALLHEFKGQKWGGFLSDGETLVTMRVVDDGLRHPQQSERDVLFFRSLANGKVIREVPVPALWSQTQQQIHEQLEAGRSVKVYGFVRSPDPVISPDGTLAASVYYDGHIGLWNTRTGQIVRMLRGFSRLNSSGFPTLVFSPDGRQLAVDSGAGEIAVWNVGVPNP